jgi:hypothetical protein
MKVCPRCIGGRVLLDEGGRQVCLACGWSIEPEPTLLEKMISNATPEAQPGVGRRATPLPADLAARVLAAVRKEAGR